MVFRIWTCAWVFLPVYPLQPSTGTHQKLYPNVWVQVSWGRGTGSPGKPQGYPCQSLFQIRQYDIIATCAFHLYPYLTPHMLHKPSSMGFGQGLYIWGEYMPVVETPCSKNVRNSAVTDPFSVAEVWTWTFDNWTKVQFKVQHFCWTGPEVWFRVQQD